MAAARVNNLFYNARKRAPCIVFIDEVDAIGRARTTLGADPGSMERESALLAMLVQMDGIHGKTEMVRRAGGRGAGVCGGGPGGRGAGGECVWGRGGGAQVGDRVVCGAGLACAPLLLPLPPPF